MTMGITVTGSRLLPVAGPLFLQFLVRWPTFVWSDSIRPEGFLSSVLLWLVIIVTVVGVGVTVALCTGVIQSWGDCGVERYLLADVLKYREESLL
ncbi:hypothetical protein Tco_1365896 [Tanacetum coccineum]